MRGLRFKVANGEPTFREQVLATEPLAMTTHLDVVMVALAEVGVSTLLEGLAESLAGAEAEVVLPVEARLMEDWEAVARLGCGFTDEWID
jgi:hypothetical protein